MNHSPQLTPKQGAGHRSTLAFPRSAAAFSLLEVIGVMAIALIVALAFAVTTTKSIDTAFATRESATLNSFASALQSYVLRQHQFPGTNTTVWQQFIASELGVSPVMVDKTDRGVSRVFWVDPTSSINGLPIPFDVYSQSESGSGGQYGVPVYRAMILAGLSKQAPLTLISTNTTFSNLWATTDTALPSDLKVQRVNLSQLFVNLQLSNVNSPQNGQYRINGGTLQTVTNAINSYFVQNTLLTLVNPSTGATNAELMLSRDFSFFYVQGFWRSVPYAPAFVTAAQTNAAAGDLATAIAITAGIFANSPYNSNAKSGATPPQVLNLMSNFMAAYPPYADWVVNSNGGTWAAPNQNNAYAYNVYTNAKNWQTLMSSSMLNLADPSGGNGGGSLTENGCTNGPTY